MSTTKGKNERIELAATEKANVCTSVRIRYLTVDRIRLGEGLRCNRAAGLGAAGGAGADRVGVGGVTTGISKSYQRTGAKLRLGQNVGFTAGYRAISLSMLKLPSHDHGSRFDSLLILLAKRFNTAYYLLLNTGEWSGGETSKWLTFVGCGGKSAKLSDSRSSRSSSSLRSGRGVFFFLEVILLHIGDATKNSTGFSEGGFESIRSAIRESGEFILRDW